MARTTCGFEDVPGGATGRQLLAVYGPTLVVAIGFDPNFNESQKTIPALGIRGIEALVDTGASHSCVDSMLATQLGLPIVNRQSVAGTAGGHEVNMHLAQIHVPALDC